MNEKATVKDALRLMNDNRIICNECFLQVNLI